jgi:hypothetical protein
VTSPSPFSPALLGDRGRDFALLVNRDNKAVRYVSGQTHGYLELTLTREAGEARFIAVDTVQAEDYRVFEQARFRLKRDAEGRVSLARTVSVLRGPRAREIRERCSPVARDRFQHLFKAWAALPAGEASSTCMAAIRLAGEFGH